MKIDVILLGRPNAGKSSLYNAMTEGRARVGNYPGVTVDILEGEMSLSSGRVATVSDLPGLYSIVADLGPDTDEGIAQRHLVRAKEDAKREGREVVVVHVIDGEQLAAHLRLSRELVALGLPAALVVSHRDEMEAAGTKLDERALAEATGAPVAWVSARRGSEAKKRIAEVVEEALAAKGVLRDFDPRDVSSRAIVRAKAHAGAGTTPRALDRWLLHPLLGPVLFLTIMATVFATIFLVADPTTAFLDAGIGRVRALVTSQFGKGLVVSFFVDGICAGAGTVLAFMPQIVLLTIAMEILEATGYLARGAFLLDRLLQTLGLTGRSFLPLLMGHACAIPAVSATRIIRDPRERLTTILVIPLMTCAARLPTYGLLLSAFFSHRGVWFRSAVMVALYAFGILGGLIASLVLRRTVLRGRSLPMVMEIPRYRVPQWRNVVHVARMASRRFLRDVGTIIVVVSSVLWFALSIPVSSGSTPVIDRSLAAFLGRGFEPVSKLAGFDWRINIGLIGSFGARELMVSTLGVIFGIEDTEGQAGRLAERIATARAPSGEILYGVPTALALIAFFVVACQCMSTVAAIRRETRSWRWPLFVLAYTYTAGFAIAVTVYQIAVRVTG